MGVFERGDIVLISMPYTDLSAHEIRPAFVVQKLKGFDVVCCQISSSKPNDDYFVPIYSSDFISGYLKYDSYVRTNKIYTLDQSLIIKKLGLLFPDKSEEIIEAIKNAIGL
jgi:mRNA interferase MazF